VATNIEGFDPSNVTTSSLLIHCAHCGDQYQVGTHIEGVGDVLWLNACPSCGTEHPITL
jgi:hypothetical protein